MSNVASSAVVVMRVSPAGYADIRKSLPAIARESHYRWTQLNRLTGPVLNRTDFATCQAAWDRREASKRFRRSKADRVPGFRKPPLLSSLSAATKANMARRGTSRGKGFRSVNPPAEGPFAPEPDPCICLKKRIDFLSRELESSLMDVGECLNRIQGKLNSEILVGEQCLDDQSDRLLRHGD
jgi:hypothetical protein